MAPISAILRMSLIPVGRRIIHTGAFFQTSPGESKLTILSFSHTHSSSVSYNASPRPSPLGYNSMSPSPSPMMYNHSRSHSNPNPRAVPLFDSSSPQHPSYGLMTEFILLFFNHLSQEYNFIAYDDVYRDFTQRRMSPPLANCIAAFAAGYVTHLFPQLTFI